MHVLLTGAGGFSGARTARALLERGHRVTAVVRSGRPPAGELEIIQGDLATDLELPPVVDAVVHAAARSQGPGVTVEQYTHDNVDATKKLVQYAKRAGARKFILFSTLSVYGRIEAPVVDESTPFIDPDAYGVSKRTAEELVAAGGIPSLALRLPGVLGPGSVRNWLTGVLAAAKAGSAISLFNPEAPFNNAVHVEDLAGFVCDLIECDWNSADVVTLAAGGQITVRDAVQILIDATGKRSQIVAQPGAKKSFVISIARAVRQYGYRPMEIGALLRRFAAE
jgi:nucleoside-diphosphate-sugar epimerase